MSSTNSMQLTEEQEKLLNRLEEEFKDRYTENDEDFKAVLNESLPLPPIVENWGDFRHRDERHDNYRARHNHYHNRRDNNDYERDRYQNYGRYDTYNRNDDGSYSQSLAQNRYRGRNYYAHPYRRY